MKILHISNYYYPHIGGIEQVARDVINSLDEHEQKLICFNHEKGTKVDVIDGIEVTRVNCQAKISSQSIALGYGKELKKLMDGFKPEVVVFHFPNPFVLHYLKKYYKRDFKLILYYHLDITKQKILKLFFKGQTLKALERADKIVATSPNYVSGSEFLRQFKEKCVVIPNCINPKRITVEGKSIIEAKKIIDKNEGKTICFAVGRHIPYKGLEYLIKASKFLDNNYKIYIGGQGPLTKSLKEMAKDDLKIEFLGRLSDEELNAYYKACDIFCFPSITKNEAFGLALAEAMYFEKPAVTFTIDGSGVNYVSLNGETGIEVENQDVEAYAKAIKRLRENGDLRKKLAVNAKKRVEELFLYDAFKTNINNLILTCEKNKKE